MESSLLSVSSTLPPELRALPHVLELVTLYLTPTTIDSAVYNDLQGVLMRFGAYRRWTVGAMDGAAMNGRLDIAISLHSSRTEGCSAAAFRGAAANGHTEVLRWLYNAFPDLRSPEVELMAAVTSNHVETVRFLRGELDRSVVGPAMAIAAANGYADVVDALLPGPFEMADVYVAAARSGHTNVLQRILRRGGLQPQDVDRIVVHGAAGGHLNVVELLVDRCSDSAINDALVAAAMHDASDVVEMLVNDFNPDVGSVLEKVVAKNGSLSMVEHLLEYCPGLQNEWGSQERQEAPRRHARNHIERAICTAAALGNGAVMRLLAGRCASAIGPALLLLAVQGNAAAIRLLLGYCSTRGLHECVRGVLIAAVKSEDVEIATLLAGYASASSVRSVISSCSSDKMAKALKKMLDPSDEHRKKARLA